MKILELTTQNIAEDNIKNKLKEFVKQIIGEQPDTFSLKEARQSLASPLLLMTDNLGYVPSKNGFVRIRLDNYALCVAEMLKREGFHYKWTWIPVEMTHDKEEKGIAIFSRVHEDNLEQFLQ